ncbi:MAG: fibronectin type III domain-containing protein [Candidatus Micrarchaeota archaeon]
MALTANSSTVGTVANVSISFTVPNSFNYTNISIEFPSGFNVAGSAIYNTSAFPAGSYIPSGFENGQVNGQIVSLLITNPISNMTANSLIYAVNVTRVILASSASTHAVIIRAAYSNVGSAGLIGIDDGSVSFSTLPDEIVGLNIGVNGVYGGTTFANASGGTFNVTALGVDKYGNTNNTGGFGFSQNNTSALVFASLGGNGTAFAVFNAVKSGAAIVNISSRLNSSAWNSTLTLTINPNVIIGVNVTPYSSTSNSSVSSTVNGVFNLTASGFDLNGNVNNTGGFNFLSSNSSIASYVSGNGTRYGIFNTATLSGTATITVFAALNAPSATTNSTTITANVHPRITAVAAGSITTNAATINWTTQESATSIVEYGTNASVYSANASSSTLVTSHSVLLNSLSSSTVYHYRVYSCSAFGLCSVSTDTTFTTSSPSSLTTNDLNQNTPAPANTTNNSNTASSTGSGSSTQNDSATNQSLANSTFNFTNTTFLVVNQTQGSAANFVFDAIKDLKLSDPQLGFGIIILVVISFIVGVSVKKI